MKHLIRCAAIGAIAWLALAGCRADEGGMNPAGHKAAADLTLKLYSVPADRTESIQDAVNSALGGIDVKLFGGDRASITAAGPGKLLVYAPRDAQSSIGSVIASLSTSPQVSAAPVQPVALVQVNVHFWIVNGVAGEGQDDPALQALAPTLAALRKTGGPLRFQLDQSAAAIATPSGDESTLIISKGSYSQAFNFRLDRLTKQDANLRLAYEDHGTSGLEKLTTQVETPFGQYIVLAQAPGACPASGTGLTNGQSIPSSCADKPAMRLLIVRVDRLPPKA